MWERVVASLLTALLLAACTASPGSDSIVPDRAAGTSDGLLTPGAASPAPVRSGPVVALTVAATGPPGALHGLDRARVVVEYPISNADTGLLVIAGKEAGTIGPLRSATPSDAAVAVATGADLVTARATAAVVDDLQQAGLRVVEEHAPPALIIRDATRRAPFNVYALTPQIVGRSPSTSRGSQRWFDGDGPLRAGRPLTALAVRAAPDLTVVWTWDATRSHWLRTYDGQPQQVADGSRAAATTVVLLEGDSRRRLPVISDVRRSGAALVLSGGQRHGARWEHADGAALPRITGTDRAPLALGSAAPWIQICAAPCISRQIPPSGPEVDAAATLGSAALRASRRRSRGPAAGHGR